MSESLVIGVDGGGTKTAAWLAPLDDSSGQRIVGRGLAGPGNPRAVGFEAAQASVDAAIESAFLDAKLPRVSVAAVCLGLAGAGRPDEQQQIVEWAARRKIAAKVRVCHDAEPILAAAAADNCGIALIAGTGSLAWGRNASGETARAGGWGYLLGDEGSGYAIALAGLNAAMRAADGRGSATDLLAGFMQKLSVASPDELVAKVYSPEMSREQLAALASVVFDYRSTDDAANGIVETAAGDLAELVVAVVRRLNFASSEYTLALAGGTLLHQLNYLQAMLAAVWLKSQHEKLPPTRQLVIVEEPVLGAVRLARLVAAGR
jgi:N-acetylglucosamine kinase-like BadF-type ATPase